MEDTTIRIPLPRIIYETIEDVFEAQIRRLAIDIGKTLNVNEKILLAKLKKEKIGAYILDDSSDDIYDKSCKSYEKNENIFIPCDEPLVYKRDFCVKHLTSHILKENINNATILTVLYHDSIKYYRDIKNKVYDDAFHLIGIYAPSKQLIIKFNNSS